MAGCDLSPQITQAIDDLSERKKALAEKSGGSDRVPSLDALMEE